MTSLPAPPAWKAAWLEHAWSVVDASGDVVCHLGPGSSNEGDAKFLALAASSYRGLVEALEALLTNSGRGHIPACAGSDSHFCTDLACRQARAGLAAARGEGA